jgi:hypothetical protein
MVGPGLLPCGMCITYICSPAQEEVLKAAADKARRAKVRTQLHMVQAPHADMPGQLAGTSCRLEHGGGGAQRFACPVAVVPPDQHTPASLRTFDVCEPRAWPLLLSLPAAGLSHFFSPHPYTTATLLLPCQDVEEARVGAGAGRAALVSQKNAAARQLRKEEVGPRDVLRASSMRYVDPSCCHGQGLCLGARDGRIVMCWQSASWHVFAATITCPRGSHQPVCTVRTHVPACCTACTQGAAFQSEILAQMRKRKEDAERKAEALAKVGD